MSRSLLVLGALLVGCTDARPPETSPPVVSPAPIPSTDGGIAYTIRFPAPHTHYVEVEATFPTGGERELELMMATWTPGSYLVREFARNVEDLGAWAAPIAGRSGDRPLPVHKTDKNRWTIETAGRDTVVVRYRLYAREMSVRSNFVDADMAMLNGASTFLTPVGRHEEPRSVHLHLADGWSEAHTALPPHPDGAARHWVAADFDTLVDSPIIAGQPAVYPFEVEGVPHQLVNLGEDGIWDGPRSARDVAAIAREQVAFWGTVPYERYLFLNVLGETRGGLEHKASTLMLTSRFHTGTREAYRDWLGLVSHEFFHTWNVKRLRPEALGPFDYEREVLTRDLWIAEGFTSYYDDLFLVRAGLISRDEYLEALSKQIASVQATPGRLVHPLSETSFDAWIKHYRGDENSPNSTVSYYRKGALVGFLLDAEIRRATDGERSLDDVMRLAYARFSGERGYRSAEFRAVASEVAGVPLQPWLERAVDGTDELAYDEALAWYGLHFAPADAAEPNADTPGWLGLHLDESGGRILVHQVRRDTPAYDAGFNVEDEILAVDDFRVPAGGWAERLKHYAPGSSATVLVARRGLLRRIPVTFGAAPETTWNLAVDPNASTRAQGRLAALLE